LIQIENGEAAIRDMGFRIFRLRHHGHRARIEFASNEMERARREPFREKITQAAMALGFREVDIDLYNSRMGQS
jgi:uncharacterized protein